MPRYPKRLVCATVLATVIVSNISYVQAAEVTGPLLDINNTGVSTISTAIHYETEPEIKKTLAALYVSDSDYLTNELKKLYEDTADQLDIPYTYVKAMHIISGGKAVFSDRRPQVYNDETLKSANGAFEIEGIEQDYTKIAPFADCPDESVLRPSKHYMPDAAYNVMSSITDLMKERESVDRGNMQPYFDALLPDAKQNVLFYEAVLKYTGVEESQVNNLYKAYERMLYKKDKDEYIVELTEDNTYKIKEKFQSILTAYGITNTSDIAVAMSFDSLLAQCDNPDKIKSEIPLHYKVGYTGRENMMIAAMSLVGKVRYVWGGGHGGTGSIRGINPIWECFNELYLNNDKANRCMKPSSTWCPVHGDIGSTSNTCMVSDTSVSTINQYLNMRGTLLSTTKAYGKIEGKNLSKIFNNGNIAYTRKDGSGSSVGAHRMEGLDCSGFTSWLFSQIDRDRIYDSGATRFPQNSGMQELSMGDKLLPGDVLAWDTHICVIVGRTDETNKVYLEIEATPNVLKLGIAYYPGATQAQINEAKALAKEANTLLGNVQDSWVNSFNIKNLEYATQAYTDADGNIQMSYSKVLTIGRLGKPYIDENEKVDGFNKTMSEMTAKEIIQNTINNLPLDYLSGADIYKGGAFSYVK